MWAEKTIILIIEISTWHVFLMDRRVTTSFIPDFTLLTFNLSLTSQSSNIIPIFVSHIPSCRLTLPFLFFFFSSVWRKDSISCKECVFGVCVCVCVLGSGWKEEQGSVERNNGMLQFASLFVCDLSLPFSLSFPLPQRPPPLSLPSQTCSRWNVRLSHRPARCLSSQPSILFALSLS